MGWAALPLVGISAGLSIMQGMQGQAAADAEKAQYEFNARSEMIAADEADAQRRSDLNDTLSSIDAIRTSRGLDLASPTGQAIAAGQTKKAESAIGIDRLNYLTKAQSDRFAATAAGDQGTASLLGGFLSAGKSIADYGSTRGWFNKIGTSTTDPYQGQADSGAWF